MSERDWKQTPTLDEFNAMYDEDDNIWWRIACGHHQNLYEAAVERYQTAEAQIQRVRELHGRHDPNCPYGEDCAGAGLCLACREEYPCATIRALEGDSE